MIRIQLNGDFQEFEGELTIQRLLERLRLTIGQVAVAVNSEVVPRSTFDTHQIRNGDSVEIVRAVSGG